MDPLRRVSSFVPWPRAGATWGRGRGCWAALLGPALILPTQVGCGPPYLDVLESASGEQIRLNDVIRIVGSAELSEEQKRQALLDLGVTDEDLIQLLIQNAA